MQEPKIIQRNLLRQHYKLDTHQNYPQDHSLPQSVLQMKRGKKEHFWRDNFPYFAIETYIVTLH